MTPITFYKQATIVTLLTLVVPIAAVIVPVLIVKKTSENWHYSNRDDDVDAVDESSQVGDQSEADADTSSIDPRFYISNVLGIDNTANNFEKCVTTRISYSLNHLRELATNDQVNIGMSAGPDIQNGSSSNMNQPENLSAQDMNGCNEPSQDAAEGSTAVSIGSGGEQAELSNAEENFAHDSPSLGWKATEKGSSSRGLLDPEEEVKNFFPEPMIFDKEDDRDVRALFHNRDEDRDKAGPSEKKDKSGDQ